MYTMHVKKTLPPNSVATEETGQNSIMVSHKHAQAATKTPYRSMPALLYSVFMVAKQ